jgi:hypothetical protein
VRRRSGRRARPLRSHSKACRDGAEGEEMKKPPEGGLHSRISIDHATISFLAA